MGVRDPAGGGSSHRSLVTPGGSLTVASAPASAVIGTLGTIDVSWTGAAAGQWHFGAVTHIGPSGMFGRTLVQVDNR